MMEIPKEVFGVSDIAARESTRYSINYVRIESDSTGRCRAIATDGHRLLVCDFHDGALIGPPNPEGDSSPKQYPVLMVPVEVWEACIKKRLRFETVERFQVNSRDGTTVASRRFGELIQTFSQKHDEKDHFPKYNEVIPVYEKDECVQYPVNPAMLAEMLHSIASPDGTFSDHCVLTVPKDRSRPIRIDRAKDGVRQTGAVMPVNLDPAEYASGAINSASKPKAATESESESEVDAAADCATPTDVPA